MPTPRQRAKNPLCGDEVSIAVSFEGDTILDVKFQRPRLRDQPGGDLDADGHGQGTLCGRGRLHVARRAPWTSPESRSRPFGSSAPSSGLGVPQLALHKGRGALPEEWAGLEELEALLTHGRDRRRPGRGVAAGRGEDRVRDGQLEIGVYNCGSFYAIEDPVLSTTGRFARVTSSLLGTWRSALGTDHASTCARAGR